MNPREAGQSHYPYIFCKATEFQGFEKNGKHSRHSTLDKQKFHTILVTIMILLLEPYKKRRKKLCDLLSRERIIGIDSIPEALEMVCKFKNDLAIIIANIHLLYDILSRKTLFKLCTKLYIDIPPLLGFYEAGDEKIKEEFVNKYKQYKLVEYDEKDDSFPE